MIAHFFINRPVFACVVSLVILLVGFVSLSSLPVAQFPDLVPPSVVITANYPGASAEDVVNTVCIPIEQQVNGVDDMIYISSSSTSDGNCTITVTFAVGTNPDMATVNVQNRVKIAEPVLPEEVRRQGVTVQKQSTNTVMFLSIIDASSKKQAGGNHEEKESTGFLEGLISWFTGSSHKEKEEEEKTATEVVATDPAEPKDDLYLSNYTSLYIKDVLSRVDGVGNVNIFDVKSFSMRLWLNPELMTARNISVQEVLGVLWEQNVQVAAGRIGDAPVPTGQKLNLPIITLGRLSSVEEFENVVLRIGQDGQILRLKDVARIELGSVSYTTDALTNGIPACSLGIMQRPGANSLHVAEGVKNALREMKRELARNGLDYVIVYDATTFVEVSIAEVVETLVIAVFLVILTVYIFLQDWRAALIPTLTIPVSLIGAFFFMMLFGFSINTLTLFGLILVIGIVVDDSIIVVENTQRIIDEEKLDSKSAAHKSMDQVAGPVIATALVLMSVFIPTAMIGGIVGQIYKQFALTIAAAVGISCVCAMTLSPALCAIFLRPSVDPHRKFVGFRLFNFCFDTVANVYLFWVKRMIFGAIIILGLWFVLIFGLFKGFQVLPTGFLPDEDQGVLFIDIKLPDGATKERTAETVHRIEKLVAESSDMVANTLFVVGFSMLDNGNASNAALGVVTLKPWEERRDPQNSLNSIRDKVGEVLSEVVEARCFVFSPPPIMGLGNAGGLQLQLLDKRPFGSQALAETAQDVIAQTKEFGKTAEIPYGTIVAGQCGFSASYPRYFLNLDREKVKQMGITLDEVFTTLQANFGSTYVNDFNMFNRVFKVMLLSDGEFRTDGEKILSLRVKNSLGKMVPFRSFASLRFEVGPQQLTRYNLYPAAAIMLVVRPDKSTGEGIAVVEDVCNSLPDGFGFDWTGMTFQEKSVGSSTMIIFVLSIVFAFLVLSAQYESWSTPIIILMAVPLGVAGALCGVLARTLLVGTPPEINIYTQIGLVLMVGLSAKNAILITEFARDKRLEGEGIVQAAYEAGRLRLRPIMMTSYAFILGVIPLVIAKGAGAAGRQAIGTAVFGGMLTETMVGIFVTPVLFVLLQTAAEWTGVRINRMLGKSS